MIKGMTILNDEEALTVVGGRNAEHPWDEETPPTYNGAENPWDADNPPLID